MADPTKPKRVRRERRASDYKTESDRIADRRAAHAKQHGCTWETCPINDALLDASIRLYDAERPLLELFEAFILLSRGAACSRCSRLSRFAACTAAGLCVTCAPKPEPAAPDANAAAAEVPRA